MHEDFNWLYNFFPWGIKKGNESKVWPFCHYGVDADILSCTIFFNPAKGTRTQDS